MVGQVGSEKLLWAKTVAVQLMHNHGLEGWSFSLNKNLRRAGVCFYPFTGKPGRIELSVHFIELNDEAEIRDTILHEIAHALTGPDHGHDEVWKAKCIAIGARPERCYHGNVNMPLGAWRAECPACNKRFHRHRRPRTLTGWHHSPCGQLNGGLVWAHRDQEE